MDGRVGRVVVVVGGGWVGWLWGDASKLAMRYVFLAALVILAPHSRKYRTVRPGSVVVSSDLWGRLASAFTNSMNLASGLANTLKPMSIFSYVYTTFSKFLVHMLQRQSAW